MEGTWIKSGTCTHYAFFNNGTCQEQPRTYRNRTYTYSLDKDVLRIGSWVFEKDVSGNFYCQDSDICLTKIPDYSYKFIPAHEFELQFITHQFNFLLGHHDKEKALEKIVDICKQNPKIPREFLFNDLCLHLLTQEDIKEYSLQDYDWFLKNKDKLDDPQDRKEIINKILLEQPELKDHDFPLVRHELGGHDLTDFTLCNYLLNNNLFRFEKGHFDDDPFKYLRGPFNSPVLQYIKEICGQSLADNIERVRVLDKLLDHVPFLTLTQATIILNHAKKESYEKILQLCQMGGVVKAMAPCGIGANLIIEKLNNSHK